MLQVWLYVIAVCKLRIPFCLFPEVKHMWFRNLHPVMMCFPSTISQARDGIETIQRNRHKE